MLHASEIGGRYLSFVTMVSCQEFYDEMLDEFDVVKIELIGKYNPNDLQKNVDNFEAAMAAWKQNYDRPGVAYYFEDLDEFERAYLAR